jgi:hypothetical protein
VLGAVSAKSFELVVSADESSNTCGIVVLSSTATVKSEAGTALVDVRWRRHYGYRYRRGYFIGSPYYGYARYSNSGCHVEGGYYRPNGCW